MKELARYCTDRSHVVRGCTAYGDEKEMTNFWFKDNGSQILAVAHLDTVQPEGSSFAYSGKSNRGNGIVYSPTLDNRLGAYIIRELLPQMGIAVDWLFTDHEEIGRSTAQFFGPYKEYNWIISFDRAGTDVVLYQYETAETVNLVTQSGARVGIGSYSDIAYMEHLGVAGFNWGCGMEKYHSKDGYFFTDDLDRMLGHFQRFYQANASHAILHDPISHQTYLDSLSGGWGDGWDDENSSLGAWTAEDEENWNRWMVQESKQYRQLWEDWADCEYCQSTHDRNQLTDHYGSLLCAKCAKQLHLL